MFHSALSQRSSVALKMTPVLGVVVHHGVEALAGLGLPLEPYLGRRRSTQLWVALLGGNLALTAIEQAWAAIPLAVTDGVWQALAVQHYADWPFRWCGPLPLITSAEEIPEEWLPVYNVALLAITASCATATGYYARRSSQEALVFVAHFVGLSTMPVQRKSAQYHQRWIASRGINKEAS